MKQSISHLEIDGKRRDGISVSFHNTEINLSPLPKGHSCIQLWYSAPCGTDGSANGYYHGGRFQKDLEEKEKLEENFQLLEKSGVSGGKRALVTLLRIPNHEGWGMVKSISSLKESERQIAAFIPVISQDRKKITGMEYTAKEMDFQNLKKGDWVVVNAALRCNLHWKINPKTGFPNPCHRNTTNGHLRKRVPGHLEIYGLSHYSRFGLPYPNQMLTKVPEELKVWIMRKKSLRMRLLVTTEPFSCCFEAFNPIVQYINRKKEAAPERIVILGDGPNAALLTLLATTIFPKAVIYIVGHTQKKLESIKAINPSNIITIISQKEDHKPYGYERLKKQLEGKKLSVVIPTFPARSLHSFADIVEKKGRVIVWAADQVHDQNNQNAFEDVGDIRKIHHSYGGWNQAEWSALNFYNELVRIYPERLEAVCRYPVQYFSLKEGAKAMDIWLKNKGKYTVEMDGHTTSAKIVFDHKKRY